MGMEAKECENFTKASKQLILRKNEVSGDFAQITLADSQVNQSVSSELSLFCFLPLTHLPWLMYVRTYKLIRLSYRSTRKKYSMFKFPFKQNKIIYYVLLWETTSLEKNTHCRDII